MVTQVATATFIQDTTLFLRDNLRSNITDPISAKRASNEKFVLSAYPQRTVTYPVIVVEQINVQSRRLGMQSETQTTRLDIQITICARNVVERDDLTQDVINFLRDFHLDATGTAFANLHDPEVTGVFNDEDPGEGSVKKKIINMKYLFLLGG